MADDDGFHICRYGTVAAFGHGVVLVIERDRLASWTSRNRFGRIRCGMASAGAG